MIKWKFGNYLFLVVLVFLCLTGCTGQSEKEQGGIETETLSAEKEGQEEQEAPEYMMSVSSMGFEVSSVQDICETEDYIFLLAMIGFNIQENDSDIFLIRCGKDGSNAVRMDPDLEKKETLQSIVKTETETELCLLTSAEKKSGTKYYWKTMDEEGAVLESRELKLKTESNYLFSRDAVVSDGVLYILSEDGESIRLFDEEGKETTRIDSSFSLSSLFMTKDGSIYTYGAGESREVFRKLDEEAGELKELSAGLGEYQILNANIRGGEKSSIYVADQMNVYFMDLENGTLESLFHWIDAGISGSSIRNFLPLKDGSFFAVSLSFEENSETGEVTAVTAKLATGESNQDKRKILTLASCGLNIGKLESMVLSFNRNNKEYKIKLIDYTEYIDPYTQMNMDILSGKVPDIFILDNLPADQYMKQKILTDLYPLLDQDKELSREDFVESVLSAAEKDGKLYYFASAFSIENGIAVGKDYLDFSGSLRYEDLEKLYEKIPEDGAIMDLEARQFVKNVVSFQMEDYMDEENKKAEFNSEHFIRLLAFAKKLHDSEKDVIVSGDTSQNIVEGKTLTYPFTISNFMKVAELNTIFQKAGGYVVSGYPSKEEDNYLAASFSDALLGISEKCGDKEGAWQFLREFFLYDYQINYMSDMYMFPTRKDVLEEGFCAAMADDVYQDKKGNEIKVFVNSIVKSTGSIILEPFKEEDVENVRSLIERIRKINNESDDMHKQIIGIVEEEIEAFLVGDKTAEETAKVIQNRAQLYLNEVS